MERPNPRAEAGRWTAVADARRANAKTQALIDSINAQDRALIAENSPVSPWIGDYRRHQHDQRR
jgi:hypothetical protein